MPLVAAPNQVEDRLIGEVFSLVVNFNVFTVQVLLPFQLKVQLARVWVPSVAGMVFGQHEYNAIVSHSHPLQVLIEY